MKYIKIKEFYELGYLQELNRRFLHTLGLAMKFDNSVEGNEILVIEDHRDDECGVFYDLNSFTNDEKDLIKKRFYYIENEISKNIIIDNLISILSQILKIYLIEYFNYGLFKSTRIFFIC